MKAEICACSVVFINYLEICACSVVFIKGLKCMCSRIFYWSFLGESVSVNVRNV